MENTKKKILMICNTSQNVFNFRLPLIKKMQAEGYEVSTITFDDKYADDLEKEGVKQYFISDKNRSVNPLKILSLKNKYSKIIQQIKPDIVFTFMLKPNVFGVPAAKKAGVKNIYAMVEGAGDAFINKSLKWKLVKFVETKLYKKAFKQAKKVFFLNNDDKSDFESLKLVSSEQSVVINGIGVDIDRFSAKPVSKKSNKFIMIARMLKTKGVLEYCECARLVKKSHPEAEFMYLGGEGTLKVADIQEYIDDGSVNYLGTAKDVRPFVEDSLALVLPSYREGMPMTIMEAESMGRAVITSNNVGCKDTVENGFNGFKVEIAGNNKDVSKLKTEANSCLKFETADANQQQTEFVGVGGLAQCCIKLLENKDLAVTLGKNARKFAEDKFDQAKINSQIFEITTKE